MVGHLVVKVCELCPGDKSLYKLKKYDIIVFIYKKSNLTRMQNVYMRLYICETKLVKGDLPNRYHKDSLSNHPSIYSLKA